MKTIKQLARELQKNFYVVMRLKARLFVRIVAIDEAWV
jgi:hypothetical protein